jgi:hypothetical protein
MKTDTPMLDMYRGDEKIQMLPVINTLMFRQWVHMLGTTFFPSLEVDADARTYDAGPRTGFVSTVSAQRVIHPFGLYNPVQPHRLTTPDGTRRRKGSWRLNDFKSWRPRKRLEGGSKAMSTNVLIAFSICCMNLPFCITT